ncbi:hypothetical protein H5410_003279 [Solanum commersonii]|uniref:Uncharacterized protein n=1 Tax=Solanum commersonii TaxID=4109 RepID=A0A9J6B4N6_SOLCO|nr:hypothetical protein H5410_003279 [Solanum commersonii]
MIFMLENSEIQRKEEPWKIFQRYLLNGIYFPGESYKTRSYYETMLINTVVEFQHFSGYITSENVYNFSKMIIKQIIPIEDWAISLMTERKFSLNKVLMKFTYWDLFKLLIKSFIIITRDTNILGSLKYVQRYFANPIPNWFLNWLSYHGPMIKILPDPFLKLYREWVKVSPDFNNLYQQEHICHIQQIEHIYFFIEFSINNLISQNNYLRLFVKVLGEHNSSLDKKLDDLTILIVQIQNDLKLSEQAST